MRTLVVAASVGLLSLAAVQMAGPPYVPSTIDDFTLPGSQPDVNREFIASTTCDNCHGDYDAPVEPAFNWRGSMMAQSGRDPLFLATMTIANQDAPESGDLCIRCHFPTGWLSGRSSPTDGSALVAADRDGVDCHFCHKLVAPSPVGTNPYPDDDDYTDHTFPVDSAFLATIADIPIESAHGEYIVDTGDQRRGPYEETAAPHNTLPSPFHRESAVCGTCHDVSNPAFSRDPSGRYVPNAFGTPPPSAAADSLFPIERTYSEWLASAYNSPTGVYAPQFGGNKDYVASCQDCHMRDVTGKGSSKGNTPIRNDLPLHDLTGGNTFVPKMIDLAYPGEADQAALDDGILRARYMLQQAASMQLNVVPAADSFMATVRVTNETGHKLPSGYPEGRRIWINLQAFDQADALVYESGAYDSTTAILTHDTDAKIYEIQPGMSPGLAAALGLPPGPSFHFVLNDTIYFDNRIPPRGFTNAGFEAAQSPPVGYSYADGQYWDDTEYALPASTRRVIARLFYQTTSKEFVEFLRDENETNHWGDSLFSWWTALGKSPPELMRIDSIQVSPPAMSADLKVFLEGAYAGGDSMSTSVTFSPAVPLNQPFSDALFSGTPMSSDTALSVFAWDTDFIDWIHVSFRTATSAASEAFATPGILKSDGSVVDTSGTAFILPSLTPGTYWIVVRHRNHLPAMTSAAVDCSAGLCTWDFTTGLGQAYANTGDGMKVLPDSKTALVAADETIDGQITAGDFNGWLTATKAALTGYRQADFNLDGQVTASDFNIWLTNTKLAFSSQVP